MITLICLLFPAVLSVWLYEKLAKHDLTKKNWCYLYVFNALVINVVCFLVKKLVLNTAQHSMSDISPAGALNYLIMAMPTAAVLAYVESLLKKNTKVTVEDEDNN